MKNVQRNFRESIQKKVGYDDTHIEILKHDLSNLEDEIKEAEPLKKELSSKKITCEKDIISLQGKLEAESPKESKLNELEVRRADLFKYAKEAILSIQNEIAENERKIRDCEGCFEFANAKKNQKNI